MNTFISTHDFAIPLAVLCAAVILLASFLESQPRRAGTRRESYLVAAAVLGSPALMIGVLYLIVRLLFD